MVVRRSETLASVPAETSRVAMTNRYPVESPLWWVNRLYGRLVERNRAINVFDDYYLGQFPLPWLAPQAEEEFQRIMRMSRANYTGLVVDAMCERIIVEGFRIDTGDHLTEQEANLGAVIPSPVVTGAIGAAAQGKALNLSIGTPGSIGVSKSSRYTQTTIGEADRETWRIWQANDMDTLFDQAILEAAINGISYLMVAPNDDDQTTPRIWVEHPSQCIVEHVPGTNRHVVAAGLKVWDDDWTGNVNATLYLPDEIHKFYAKRPPSGNITTSKWLPRTVDDEEWPAGNPVGVVPIFELPNNPRLLSGGRSELEDLIDTQDRIVKTIADRLMTQDYGAFTQKWATGWPETDAAGKPNTKIDVGRDRMITTDVPEAKFGQFDASDLQGYMMAKKEDVHDMAARSRTPAQYLLGEFSNVNGETLKASESGLVAKVRQRMRGFDDPLESAIRLVRKIAGNAIPDDVTMETVWRNPEFRTEGEVVDALTKMSTLGVPQQALWERWGASPPEIQRWTEMQVEMQRQQAAMDATALLADSYRKSSTAGGGTAGGPGPGGAGAPATPSQNGSGSSAPAKK